MRFYFTIIAAFCINSACVAGLMIQSFEDMGIWSGSAPKINASGTVVGLVPVMNKEGEYEERIAIAPVNGPRSFIGPVLAVNAVFNLDINDSDVVMASYQDGNEFRVVLIHPSDDLDYLENVGAPGINIAYALNNSNDVVGHFPATPGNSISAYRWNQNSGYQNLGNLGGHYSIAFDVNNSGAVVGEAENDDNRSHAFRHTEQQGMIDLGALGGEYSSAHAVNERGAVVGRSDTRANDDGVAFFYDDESGMQAMEDDPSIRFSEALDINNNDWAVGHAWRHGEGVFFTFGFLWTPEAGFLDLNTLLDASADFFIESATSINDAGQIVGIARRDDGQGFLYRLTITSIPSPTAAPMLLGLLAMRRRRGESG